MEAKGCCNVAVTLDECKKLYPHCGEAFFALANCFQDRRRAEKLLSFCNNDMNVAQEIGTLCHGNFCLVEKLVDLFDLFEKDLSDACRFLKCFRDPKDSAYSLASQFLALFSNNVSAATSYLARFNNEGAKAIQAIKAVMAMFADEASFKIVLNGCNSDVSAAEAFVKLSGIKKLEVLYDTEKHKRNVAVFHAHCDWQGPTVTFYASKTGCACGFTSLDWYSADYSAKEFDNKSYLCRLAPNPQKFPFIPDDNKKHYSTDMQSEFGPLFGGNIEMGFEEEYPKGIFGWFCKKGSYGLPSDQFIFPKEDSKLPLERVLVCRIPK